MHGPSEIQKKNSFAPWIEKENEEDAKKKKENGAIPFLMK